MKKKFPVSKKSKKKVNKKYIDYSMTSFIFPVLNKGSKPLKHTLSIQITSKKKESLEFLLPWIEEYVKNLPAFMQQAIKKASSK